jgi:HEAT repeat protein
MSRKLSIITNLIVVTLILLATAQGAYAQDIDELLNQLSGKAEAPARNAEQLAQAYEKAVDYLLPLMSADDVGSRYQYQITLQNICSYASRPGAENERRTLAIVLCRKIETTRMLPTVSNWFVLQLQRIGKDESVKTLTNLLSSQDTELRDYARRALEKNPSDAAMQSLEQAMEQANDPAWKAALANSIRQRDQFETVVKQNQALEQRAAVLTSALIKGAGPDQLAAARELVDIAGKLIKRQKFEKAMSIYDDLNNWAVKQGRDVFFIRAAALNGIATCDGQHAVEVVTTAMRSDNPKIRSLAVQAARNAPTKDAMRALSEMLAGLDPYYQQQVLGLIADRGDLSSVKFVKGVLDSESEPVRLAAIETLTKLGGDEAAEALLKIAVGNEGAVQKAAYAGLSVMVGPRVEDIIKARAASGEVDARVVAIGLLGQRRAVGSLESLLAYAGDNNAEISAAAFKALPAVADSKDIPTLADLLTKTENGGARQNAVAALRAVLAKTTDKDAAAQVMIDKMNASGKEVKLLMLSTLNALGGPVALKTVTDAAKSSDEALRDAGIRTLSEWPDFEAAEILLGIATNPETTLTHHVLAVRSALRLIKSSDSAPLGDRVKLCFYAFDNARREEEKKQVISAMGSLPSEKVAARLLELTKDESLKTEAGLAGVELAGNMLRTNRQAARDLAQKIRDLNISDEINSRADRIIKGRRRR